MPERPAAAPFASTACVAPAWHTVVVLVVIVGVSLIGAHLKLPALLSVRGRVPSYLLTMVIEWGTVAFIWWGLRRSGITLSDLIGGRWQRWTDIVRDVAIGIAFIIAFALLVQVLNSLLKITQPQAVRAMLPQTTLETILWVPLSLTGGFCEEIIFRGYFQRQFSALTRSIVGGVALQGAVFGLAHGYQGWHLMSIIALFGVCFGALAQWRHSLRPGIFGHCLQDTAAGLLSRLVH